MEDLELTGGIKKIIDDTIDQMVDKSTSLSESNIKQINVNDFITNSEQATVDVVESNDQVTWKLEEPENSNDPLSLPTKDSAPENVSEETNIERDVYEQVEEDIKQDETISYKVKSNDPKTEERKKQILNGQDLFDQTLNELGTLANEGESKQGDTNVMNEDVLCVYKIMSLIREHHGETDFSIYNKLTPTLKERIKRAATANGVYGSSNIQTFTKLLFAQLYQDSEIDGAWKKLQEDIKEADKMPEHMDIFGSVIYNKMVREALLQVHMAHEAEPEKIDIESNGLTLVAKLTVSSWFLEPLYTAVLLNRSRFKKSEKKFKQNVDDIEYIFSKFDIKSSSHNTPKELLNLLHLHTNDLNPHAHEYLAAAIIYALEGNKSDTRNYIALQFVFLQSLIIGVLSYINPDEDVQTDEGKLLWNNFKKFLSFCELVLESNWEANLVKSFVDAPQEVLDKYNTISKAANELFVKEMEQASEKCKENMALKQDDKQNQVVDSNIDNVPEQESNTNETESIDTKEESPNSDSTIEFSNTNESN